MRRCAGIIKRRKDARGLSFFNKVAYNLVVEVLDGRPLDLFPDVFFLLRLEGKLDEDLLQFLIDVINA